MCQYTLSALGGEKFPNFRIFDFSYESAKQKCEAIYLKNVFLPSVFLGLEFNETFELRLVPFK